MVKVVKLWQLIHRIWYNDPKYPQTQLEIGLETALKQHQNAPKSPKNQLETSPKPAWKMPPKYLRNTMETAWKQPPNTPKTSLKTAWKCSEFRNSQERNREEKLYEHKITVERNKFLKITVLSCANQFHTVSLGSWRTPTHPKHVSCFLGELLTTAKGIFYLIIPFLLMVSCCVMFPFNMQHGSTRVKRNLWFISPVLMLGRTPELELWGSPGILTYLIEDLAHFSERPCLGLFWNRTGRQVRDQS